MMRRKRPFCLLLMLSLLLLAGCRLGESTITVQTDGMRFVQGEVQTKAGQPVTLRVVNQDDYAHAFDMDEFDIHTPLAANESATFVFTPEQAGRYTFYCGVPGHEAAGMVGVLIVTP
ncbi:MAG: cupredoxin domain-containing protein [Anaerolineae bacterium]|nr:cupredoxin domain-containing protein [Anaerolineae bacterium]